jgi:transcriptional regulator of acetoin/glycerol metabolism
VSSVIPRVNLLVVGPCGAVEELLARVVDGSEGANSTWRPGHPFDLPAIAPFGTMVLRDVDTLMLDDQRRLLEWLELAAGIQVISTASAPVLSLVDAGAFLQRLYYRLNTIYIDLASGGDPFDW